MNIVEILDNPGKLLQLEFWKLPDVHYIAYCVTSSVNYICTHAPSAYAQHVHVHVKHGF